MKTRESLVSNSSTSSFICIGCGEVEAGMDLCLDECYMFRCVSCDGTFHESCVKIPDELKVEFSEALSENRYEMDEKYCPRCQMKQLDTDDVLKFCEMKHGLTHDVIVTMMKDEYGSRSNFIDAYKKWKAAE